MYIHVLQAVVYLPFIAVGLILLMDIETDEVMNLSIPMWQRHYHTLNLRRDLVYLFQILYLFRILRKSKVVVIEWASSNLFFILDTCDVLQKLVKEKIDFDLFRHVIHVIWSAVHENITGYLLYVSFWGLTAWIESFETLISHCIW